MSTLRERIENILIENKLTPEQVGTITGQILGLGRSKEGPIIHRIGPNGFHQLQVDDKKSGWSSPTDIIRLGDYIAATDAYIDLLPQVGKIYQIRDKDLVTQSVQALS